MAFDAALLSLQASGAYSKQYAYRSADAAEDVLADDYFLLAQPDLDVGDVIFVHAGYGTTAEFYIAMVAASTTETVTTVCTLPLVAFADLGDLILDPP